MIQGGRLEAEQARELVRACFYDLSQETEGWGGFLPGTNSPDLEIEEQREIAREQIAALRSMVVAAEFDGTVKAKATEALENLSFGFSDLSVVGQADILSGVARALIEQQNLFIHRLTERLLPFHAQDSLFLAEVSLPSALTSPAEPPAGPTLEEAIERYLADGKKQWVKKTYLARVWQMRFLCEHLGAKTKVGSIGPHDVRGFRDAVLKLRKNHGRTPSQSFAAKQTDNADKRIAAKTAALIFEPTKAFLRWCKSVEGMIPTNPAEDVRIIAEKKPKGQKTRRPFRREELERLFLAPLYTGCQSVHRRYEPGDRVLRDAKYWLPILGFYTGCRLGELVQLRLSDLRLDEEIPTISINQDNEGGPDAKHVKSLAGLREVPIHPDVMELGFARFVAERRKKKKAGGRLFWEFPYGSDGQASTVASKWFARFKSSVGLTDRTIVFHSFRHNAEDAFRDALKPQYVIDRIIGHSDTATSAGYGDGISLETAYEVVRAMKLKIRLPQLWAQNSISSKST
ncbi:MAG TPA: site-specific integrase [Allosphingosinicella sp.]|nr:site-specific integrase [Allosphingosinicella sp.]